MVETLENNIRQNESFRQALLAQEGGIMKYWAEHPDAEFDTNLYDGYEQQIVEAYLWANRRSRTVAALSKNDLSQQGQSGLTPLCPTSKFSKIALYVEPALRIGWRF